MSVSDTLNKVKQILDLLEENDPDKNEILRNETDVFALMDWCIRKDAEFNEMAESNKNLAALYKQRQGRFEANSESIRSVLETLMDAADIKSHKGAYGTATIKPLGQKPIILDVEKLPECCIKTEKKPIMAEVKKLLETTGCEGAELSNGGSSLVVRRR